MELHNLYGNADIIKMLKSHRLWWTGHVVQIGDGRMACKILLGRLEGTYPHGRLKIRWEGFKGDTVDYEGDWKTLAHGMLMSWST